MTDIKLELKGGNANMECYGCNSSCDSSGKTRGFLTNAEKIEMLKEYKKSLENEALGVSERIAELEDK